MEWSVRLEAPGTLTDEQAHALLARTFSVYVADTGQVEITVSVSGPDYAQALRAGKRAYDKVLAVLPAGTIGAPFRVTVEQVDAPTGYPILSTGGIAQLLGVSDARVRQLAQRPDFPRPLSIPGLDRGTIYSAAAVEAWARSWDRDAKGGRPRRADG